MIFFTVTGAVVLVYIYDNSPERLYVLAVRSTFDFGATLCIPLTRKTSRDPISSYP
jgi:hypothetical protein